MTLENARSWIKNRYFDAETRKQAKLLSPQELETAFFTELKFGTGGLRGVMGVGTSRINIYTIRKATQGLAAYIKQHGDPKKGVVIGYDSRINSELFARETARVLLGNKIRVYLCRKLRPTPFISFACRHLHAAAAVMITASHNPKEYNGYKVYWNDGAQIVPPHDKGIIQEIEKIPSYSDIKLADLKSPLLKWIDKESGRPLSEINLLTSYFFSPEEKRSQNLLQQPAWSRNHSSSQSPSSLRIFKSLACNISM